MTYILLTVGMLAKIISVIIPTFKKRDLITIGLGIAAGLYIVSEIYSEFELGNTLNPWWGLPVGFAAVIAFGFKDRLLRPITEGTLFTYGLVGSYLFSKSFDVGTVGTSIIDSIFLIFIACYVGLSLILIFYSRIVSKSGQTLLMVLFIMMSVFIGYSLAINSSFTLNVSSAELVVIGFCYLPLVANIFYLFYFFPLPLSKHESFTQRMANIKEHSTDLERKFIATDATHRQIILVVALFLLMLVTDTLTTVSEATLVAFLLVAETVINRVLPPTPFTPATITEKL